MKKNESAQKYNGKIIEIIGKFVKIESNDSLSVVVFVFKQGDFGDEGIRCTLLPHCKQHAAQLNPGAEIHIKGLCAGYNDTDVIYREMFNS